MNPPQAILGKVIRKLFTIVICSSCIDIVGCASRNNHFETDESHFETQTTLTVQQQANSPRPSNLPQIDALQKSAGDSGQQAAESTETISPELGRRLQLEWASTIREKVAMNWQKPRELPLTYSCVVRVEVLHGGSVASANIAKSCGGGTALDDSIIKAVLKSDPLPVPANPNIFEKVLYLTFADSAHPDAPRPATPKTWEASEADETQFKTEHPTDFIARVLNYTDSCDQGRGCWWYKKSTDSCIYAKAMTQEAGVQSGRMYYTLTREAKVLDLNSLDPKYIKVHIELTPDFISQTKVEYQGRALTIASSASVDSDRAVNGWHIIYEKYCHGSQAEF